MNITHLLQYISRQIHTIVRWFDDSGSLLGLINERVDFTDSLSDPQIDAMLKILADSTVPQIITIRDTMTYCAVKCEEYSFLIGPVILEPFTQCIHQMPETQLSEKIPDNIYHCSLEALDKEALLLHNLFHDTALFHSDIVMANCPIEQIDAAIQRNLSNLLFTNQENAGKHNPFDQELREVSSIENGDIEQLEKSWAEDYEGTIGTLAKTPLRHFQNLGIVLVTLASRAAMRGGVTPELAFSMSDSYICKLEEITSPDAAYQLGKQAEYQYTLLVRESRSKKSTKKIPDSRVSNCKDYIFHHLHEKILISDIASQLYLNPNYLSDLFRKEEGITIGQYILKEKIKLVKNLLVYSNYSYIEIASYLCFSSQSYLGIQFKKETGYTLHQYREKFKVKDFF